MSSRPNYGQLGLTAVIASAVSIAAVLGTEGYLRRRRRKQLNTDVQERLESLEKQPQAIGVQNSVPTSKDYGSNEMIIREQLARNYAFFGEEGMRKIRNSRVVVVGCGGVGSWAAIMLARSGVSFIRLIDFDYVTLSSLNRHATATLTDVGTPKVKCVERTIHSVANWVKTEACVDVWRKEEGSHFLRDVDWVIDAIDNIGTKVDLLQYCHDNRLKVFASMGAGAKCDPTRVQISDIADTVYDPLARSVRRRLRAAGIASGVPVVYSTETPSDVKLLPLPEEELQKGAVKELSVLDDFRVRILPVLGTLPAIFGLNIATYVLCDLANKPIPNPLGIKGRRKLYEKLHAALIVRESRIQGRQLSRLPFQVDDIAFLFEDFYRGRSIIPPYNVPTRPVLLRWDSEKPLSIENCVVMDAAEADLHTKNGSRSWGEDVHAMVEQRQHEIRQWRSWLM